jgi:integrase
MKGCRPLDDAEVMAVLASFEGEGATRDRALFLLGLRSGFRVSELLSLRLCDILQAGEVAPRVAVRRCHMKKKIEGRSVILHPEAKVALTAWVAELAVAGHTAPETFVFRSRKGANAPISRVQAWRVLHGCFAAAGLSGKLGTHSMRKSFAARVYERLGHDLIKTAAALGHKNINSTVSYLSFAETEIEAAILAA